MSFFWGAEGGSLSSLVFLIKGRWPLSVNTVCATSTCQTAVGNILFLGRRGSSASCKCFRYDGPEWSEQLVRVANLATAAKFSNFLKPSDFFCCYWRLAAIKTPSQSGSCSLRCDSLHIHASHHWLISLVILHSKHTICIQAIKKSHFHIYVNYSLFAQSCVPLTTVQFVMLTLSLSWRSDGYIVSQ